MNKYIPIFLCLIGGLVLFFSCAKDCATELCPTPNSRAFYIRLLDQADQDLLTGPNKRYDTSVVRILARKNGVVKRDTLFRGFVILKNKAGSADSLISTGFDVSRDYATYYLSLDGTVTDSLFFGYKPSTSECCDLSRFFLDRVNSTDVTDLQLPNSYVFRK